MMWMYYISILIVVFSNIIYHISQKSTPSDINPMVSLLVTYITAALFCLIILPFYPHKDNLVTSFKKLNWASVALGIAVVGLEFGFLLAYRAGWDISIAQFYSTLLVTLLLIPIGILFFKESINGINVIGILLCLGGFVLLTYKK